MGYPYLRWVEDGVFDKPGCQPLLEDLLRHRNMREEPVMADPVITRLDIAFEPPFRTSAVTQYCLALLYRVGGASLGSEPIGVRVRRLCSDGGHSEEV